MVEVPASDKPKPNKAHWDADKRGKIRSKNLFDPFFPRESASKKSLFFVQSFHWIGTTLFPRLYSEKVAPAGQLVRNLPPQGDAKIDKILSVLKQ